VIPDFDDASVIRAANQALERASLPHPDGANAQDKPLVFVVGAPRSGTTLLHQLLATALPLDYVDNIVARFWLKPSLGIALSRQLLGHDRHREIVYRSRLGVSEGLAGPHEFGYFWSKWFRFDDARTHHLDDMERARVDLDGLKRTLDGELLSMAPSGFLFKNMPCGFQARDLAAIHPKSLFVHVRRDIGAAAASILSWRHKLYGNYSTWFSLKPSTYPLAALAHDPVAQVIEQIRSIDRELVEVLAQSGGRTLNVAYESICADPQALVDAVVNELSRLECDVTPRKIEWPAHQAADQVSLPDEISRRLLQLAPISK
jgi:LPS sulfotransferase NodH